MSTIALSRSTDLVPVDAAELANRAAVEAALEKIEFIRGQLPTADAATLIEMRAYAKAMDATAQARQASELAVAACAVQVEAERRLGTFLKRTQSVDHIAIDAASRRTCRKLAAMPPEIFEEVMELARRRSKSFSGHSIYRAGRRISLKWVEPGILQAWDGACYVGSDMHTSGRWRRDLEEARELIREETGLKTTWKHSSAREELDTAYARARKLAQALSLLKASYSPDVAKCVGEAELQVAKAAEALNRAHTVAHIEARND